MSTQINGWIGVDLDGTLAKYDGWKGAGHIGEPIPAMLDRVKDWLADGKEVRIFTARVSPQAIALNNDTLENTLAPIKAWCIKHIGCVLPVTHEKDMAMLEFWDDRCVTVEFNTGRTLTQKWLLSHPMQSALVFAARYSHFRKTGAALMVVGALKSCWPQLDEYTQEQILEESLEATENLDDWAELRVFAKKP